MSVVIPVPIRSVQTQQEPPSKTYRLDLDRGRILGMVDNLEAVNQAIKKVLISPRFKCLIYDNQYGSEIKAAISAGDVTPELLETDIPRLVKDALSTDSRILDVFDFVFSIQDNQALIRFKVNTIFGETVIQEVI